MKAAYGCMYELITDILLESAIPATENEKEKRDKIIYELFINNPKISRNDIAKLVAKELGESDSLSATAIFKAAKDYHNKHHSDIPFPKREAGRKRNYQ
jgi:hypothetical protein